MKLALERRTVVLMAVLPLLLLTACRRPPEFNGEVVEPLAEAPALAGVNWDGKPFRLRDHTGKVVLVFFGYTYCPDVCPFTLAKMKQLSSRLGDRAKDFEVVFVSVDPQRDTVDKLARYVPNFDPRFYGLRIEEDALTATSKRFGVTVQYGMPKAGPETASYYYVDHTGTFFIVDREGRLRLKFPPSATVDQMLPDLEKLLAEPSAGPDDSRAGLEVREPRAMLTPSMGAVYFTVVNPGPRSDRLLRVETLAAGRAETHETVEENGVMRMKARPEGFEVPAGGTLELQPGGKHVMLVGPRAPSDGGSTGSGGGIGLTLHFEHAGAIEVQAAVTPMGGEHP